MDGRSEIICNALLSAEYSHARNEDFANTKIGEISFDISRSCKNIICSEIEKNDNWKAAHQKIRMQKESAVKRFWLTFIQTNQPLPQVTLLTSRGRRLLAQITQCAKRESFDEYCRAMTLLISSSENEKVLMNTAGR